ncbi:prolyl oligopeptidase family serine peptidase [Roseateles paludis]|uniref:prolyl oligopeptidase n=1 Tax=Roseateles paludis TaxID=3145238 RepID=A0ABV0G256_9BURK
MKHILLVAALLSATSVHSQSLDYPATRKTDQVDAYFDTAVADPYRWLEDDNSAETAAWVKAQNSVTERYLAALPQRQPVRKLYTELMDFERYGLPQRAGKRYFWTRNDGLQQHSVLYMADSLTGTPRVAIDPNLMSADGTVALSGIVPSPDGKLLAYGIAGAGSDWQSWKVRDLATGQDLADDLQWVKFTTAVWTKDGKGFFYGRYDAPAPGAKLTGVNVFQKLYYHRIGTPQSEDQLVAENREIKEWGFRPTVSSDGRWLLISVWRSTASKNGLMALPLPGGAYQGGTPRAITLDFGALYSPVDVVDNRLLVRTDEDAPRGRLVAMDLKGPPTWTTLVPEGPDAMTSASAIGGRLLLTYLNHASTLVRLHDAKGKRLRDIPLPGIGTASGFGGEWQDRETFFSYTSLTTPAEIHRLDLSTGKTTLFKRPKTAFNPDEFETRREFIASKDGTRVPIFIAARKGLVRDGRQPTLLYGYGGFNVSQTPGYSVTAATWMRMGGVYVLASLRGGGEYGADWHAAGTLLRKQNVFDDFIGAAEWLIANKITSPARLSIYGGSNGGLLVGAVTNQRPELFAAAVPAVGVMDMLRYHRFTIGWAWASDYGTSDDEAQFRALQAYSPLHNIRSGTHYPAVLVTTADHDDRVVPAHSFKYTAALQAAATGPAPKLIRIETKAGHGAGKPTAKIIEERGDVLAFLANALQLDVR